MVEQSYRLEERSNAVSYELSVFPEDLRRQARPVSGFVTSTAWPQPHTPRALARIARGGGEKRGLEALVGLTVMVLYRIMAGKGARKENPSPSGVILAPMTTRVETPIDAN